MSTETGNGHRTIRRHQKSHLGSGPKGNHPQPPAKTLRKACGNPQCPKLVPMYWTFCKDRNCQDQRMRVRNAYEAQLADAAEQERLLAAWREFEERKEATKRRRYEASYAYVLAYKKLWRVRAARTARTKLQRAVDNGLRARREQYDRAVLDAEGELAELIAEQHRDDARAICSTLGIRSLDAPLHADADRTLHDTLDQSYGYGSFGFAHPTTTARHRIEWSDPTFDAVTEIMGVA